MARRHTLFNFNYFKFVVFFFNGLWHRLSLPMFYEHLTRMCILQWRVYLYIHPFGGVIILLTYSIADFFDQLVRVEGLSYNSAFVCFSFQPYHFLVSCILRLFCLKCVYLGLLCLPGRLILLSFAVSPFVSSKIFFPYSEVYFIWLFIPAFLKINI